MEKMGIKETKEVVRFTLKLAQAIQGSLSDGNIGVMDALKFLPVLKDLRPALQGMTKIPAEFKDLDDRERDELVAYIKEEFDLENDTIEAYVEMALTTIISLSRLIMGFFKK